MRVIEGISVFDFTDPAHPKEIAYFDRGPIDANKLVLGGYWSAYWYNGHIYGTEIMRGLDIFALKPSEYLSQNEIDAANLVHWDQANPSDQQKIVWPAAFVVARAYVDQLNRNKGLSADALAKISSGLDKAEQLSGAQRAAALKQLTKVAETSAKGAGDPDRVRALAESIQNLANARS